jgi:hypothetical protein
MFAPSAAAWRTNFSALACIWTYMGICDNKEQVADLPLSVPRSHQVRCGIPADRQLCDSNLY